MSLEEPGWWYAREPTAVAGLLHPIGKLYGWVAEVRYERTKPYRARLPVVCIGNFTAGGTGKTPLVLHLCRHLIEIGQHPVALSRGYGGTLPGPYWVDASRDRAAQVGDEPLLLAAQTRTVICRDRVQGAKAIEHGPNTASVIVMDDGLQNASLAKDLSIAVIDGGRGFGNGRTIPAGPLRAPLDFQMELADAIVVNERAGSDGEMLELLRRQFAGPVLGARVKTAGDTAWLKCAPVVAWAGIGAPERFFALLEQAGAEVLSRHAFADHHSLSDVEATALVAAADRSDALLVTTEKDLARLAGAGGACDGLRARSRTLPIRLAFSDADAERLHDLVAAALSGRRG